MLERRKSSDRGVARFKWLESRHTFSFGSYDDPRQQGFSDLLVVNEDRVQPGTGFDMHSHSDMEIFTYVLQGALEHKDSTGTGSVIRPGDVQLMSAGSGILHSEFNPSDSEIVHFLQIWIVPQVKGARPHYQQARFDDDQKRGRLRLIISPNRTQGSLSVFQDAALCLRPGGARQRAGQWLAASRGRRRARAPRTAADLFRRAIGRSIGLRPAPARTAPDVVDIGWGSTRGPA